ncbi:MAG: M1 family metallopeptidase [Novosphingobium sp.]
MRPASFVASLLASTLLAAATAIPVAHAEQAAAVAAPAATSAQSVPAGRLSEAVLPIAYRLDLTIDPDKERFSGKVEIDVTLKQAANHIFLHGRDLTMHKATATVGGKTFIGTWSQPDPTGTGVLTFKETLPAGPITLSFDYDAPFTNGAPSGLFRVNVGGTWYSWSQFQSIDARAAFPSFDEPGFKTPFTVTIRTRPGHTAVSNAPQISTTTENGFEVHRFAPTLPLPTYLVALMVGPFAKVEGTVPVTAQRDKPLPLRVISTQPNAGQLDFALQGSKEIVALLEKYFADGFPYPKLDQITSPVMPGAMENAGADLYGDPIIVMEENAPVPQKRSFGMIVAHELAHQWFGDLVTPAWWDDIWLNESFANWMGYRIGNEWRPDLNIGSGALAEGFAAMNTDSLLAGRPIRNKIETNSEIDAAFDSITYGKGGHVVAMIAAFMGDEKFREGVRSYMKAHRNGNATSADFFRAMAEVSGDPRILPAMQSFTDQQGVPLLTFTGKDGSYGVTQSAYARFGTTPPQRLWGVPLCVRKGDTRKCELMSGQTMDLQVDGAGPLIPNAGGTGYYRFELPAREWDALIATASTLPGGEAQAVADSLGASLRAGRAGAGQLAKLARELVRNPDSYAADAATAQLAGLASQGVFDETAMASWRKFVETLYRPLLTQHGFEPRAGAHAGDDPDRQQRRTQIVGWLAGQGKDAELNKKLADAAKAWLSGVTKALDPAWFNLAFDAHVAAGGVPAAKALFDRALASEDPVFRPIALSSVAESGKEDVARWLLEEVKDDRLRSSEKIRVLLPGILDNAKTRDYGYSWLVANFDKIVSAGGGIFATSRLPQILNGFCSVEKADQIARDIRPRLANTPGRLELERTIERVRNCGLLKDAKGAQISAAMAKMK